MVRGSVPGGRPPLPLARRWLALGILCAASLMVILDGTIVTVALPAIAADLGFTAGNLSWVMTAYLIAFGGLLLLGGRLGDLLGRKRLFLAGIAVFVLASLACGLAIAPWMLIAARFVQGGGAAMASAVTLGMIVRLFDSPAQRSRAIGAFAFTGAVGASAGLILGGLLVQYASWHWIFFVNLPVGAATALAGWRVLSGDTGLGLRAGADGLGALLATSGVMLAVFAIASGDWPACSRPRCSPGSRFGRRADAAASAARARVPRLARPRALFIIGAAMGFQVIVILYLQRALGYGAAAAGLGLLPTALVIAVVSLGLSARLTARFGARALLLSGLAAITGALAVLTQVPAHAAYAPWLLPPLVAFGIGGGLALPALTAFGMAGATDADAGVISGLFNTTQQVGGALGVAVLTALASARTGGGTSAQALTSGYHLAWLVGTGLGVASIAVAAAVLLPRRGRVAVDADAADSPAARVAAAQERPVSQPCGR